MSKLKQLWGYIIGAVGLVIAVLVYYLGLKNKQINALKAEVELADTKNKVTVIETEVKLKKEQIKGNVKEVQELDKLLVQLEEKKKEIARNSGASTTKQIEDFWKEN